MFNLIYKDFKLTIHWFFSLAMPLLSALLFLIPQWPFLLVFMYFFFVTVPTLYSNINAQGDNEFILTMPVSKDNVVRGRIYAMVIIELAHILIGGVFILLRNRIYGPVNFLLDTNAALLGLALVMFGLYNLVFFPLYYKTAYHYGLAAILGVVVTVIYGVAVETAVLLFTGLSSWLEGWGRTERIVQLLVLLAGAGLFLVMNRIALALSIRRFSRVDL